MLVSSPLVGRSEEFGYLSEALASARADRGGAVFVTADAGLGRSRLLGETIEKALDAGMTVLRGRATETGATVPYRPLTEALFSLARTGAVPDEPELAPYRAVLGRLIPQWRHGPAAESYDSPVVLAESVLRLLGVVGRDRGCLLVLSDLQDCDAETMYVLEYLSGNLAGQPVLLLGSMAATPSPALTLARGAARRRAARLIELAPLTDDQVLHVVAGCLGTTVTQLSEPLARWLVQTADGNPFVVEELLAECTDTGVLAEREGTWLLTGRPPREMPATVVTSVNDRARRLGAELHRALQTAALIGRRFPLEALRTASGLDSEGTHRLVRAAAEAQLLSAPDSPDWCSFRRSWTAEALAGEVPPAERRSLAAAAADAIEALPAEPSGELCQLAAGLRLDAGDEAAAGLLYAQAGRYLLAEGAATSAMRLLDRALELLPERGHAGARAEASASLFYAIAEAGDIEHALRRGAELEGSVLLSPDQRAELLTRLAWVCVVGGHWDRAMEQVAHARTLLSGAADPARTAALDVVEAHVLTLADNDGRDRDRAARAEELATHAVRLAEQIPLPDVACQGRQVLALLARSKGFDAADVHLRRMLATAEEHGLLIWRLRAQIRLATNELMLTGRNQQILLAREAAIELGALTAGAQADASIAMQHVLYCEFDQAEELADRLLESATRMHQEGESQYCLVIKIAAQAHQGRREAMRSLLGEFRDRGGEQSFHAPVVYGHRAICALLGEDRPGAEAEMARVREWERTHPTIYYQSGRYGLGVLLEILAGREGGEHIEATKQAPASRLRWNLQFVLAAEAVLLGRSGRAQRAAELMAESQTAAAPFPMAAHLLLRLLGEAALDDGWGDPVDWLRTAERHFHSADVAPVAGACRALLRRAGVRVMQRRTGADAVPPQLAGRGVTAREFEVLLLLGERRGNPEIAQLLFISRRTVEKHVASLLDKLGRADRRELSELVAERYPGLSSRSG